MKKAVVVTGDFESAERRKPVGANSFGEDACGVAKMIFFIGYKYIPAQIFERIGGQVRVEEDGRPNWECW